LIEDYGQSELVTTKTENRTFKNRFPKICQPPTKEGLLELLKRKVVRKEAADLKNGKTTFDEMVKRTKSQWLRRCPDYGDDIFNYLHPDQSKPHSFSIF
jgi:hypothetical protein